MTAVGLILLSAALLQTIEPRELRLFTGYSREFISAIGLNMQNNKLWTEGRYEYFDFALCRGNYSIQDGFGTTSRLHADRSGCQPATPNSPIDSCKIYWDERSRSAWRNR